MNARDVKYISQFISGEDDPISIDVYSLYFLLCLTSNAMSLAEKMEKIIHFMSFDEGSEGIEG